MTTSLAILHSICKHFATIFECFFLIFQRWNHISSNELYEIFNFLSENLKLLSHIKIKSEENSYKIQNLLKKSEIFTIGIYYSV